MAPAGLDYLGSWVTADLGTCYQVTECESRPQLDRWMSRWDDLVRFEVIEVMTSLEAAAVVERRM